MIKQRPGYFHGVDWWQKNKGSLIFRDEAALVLFQAKALDHLRVHYGHPEEPLISQIPACRYSHNTLILKTSGAMSSVRREYAYPLPQYEAIENHHWWRIEKSWGLTAPGNIVEFFYNSKYLREGDSFRELNPLTQDLGRPLDDQPEDKLNGPMNIISLGSHNKAYHISYNRFTSSQTWIHNLKIASALKPKLLVMSPSQFQTAWFQTGGFRFECPVVMTREVLSKETREQASQAFTAVIDKMRCWDGGLGFYECPAGRRHIYDELAVVREEEGRLISTDLFNYAHPFINYWNGDVGKIDYGRCACGVFGNYLSEIHGRINDAIVIGDVVFPGSIIVEEVTSFFRFGSIASNTFQLSFYEKYPRDVLEGVNVLWRVRQRTDQSIEFRYVADRKLTPLQNEALSVAIKFLIGRDPQGHRVSELDRKAGVVEVEMIWDEGVYDKVDNRSKTLNVTSDCLNFCVR